MALREAEINGVDVDTRFPSLVASRALDDADDVAAVLHERVDQWMSTAGDPVRASRISGLFAKAPDVPDPDMRRALDDREALIEQRSGEAVRQALAQGQPWIGELGTPPAEAERRERWTRCAETVAAYRERWGITGRHVLGSSEAMSLEQEAQRRLAQRAVDQALQSQHHDHQGVGAIVQSGDRRLSREGLER